MGDEGLHSGIKGYVDESLPGGKAVVPGERTANLGPKPEPAAFVREEPELSASYLRPGTKLGPYEIVEELGYGGMGRVFKARDKKLEREVAVKVMRSRARFKDDADIIEKRFHAEAVLAAAVSHPNIIIIYDRGVHEDCAYFVMEYIDGATSLAGVVDDAARRGEYLELDVLKDWFLQGTSALRAIHARKGTWHRDFKLDNLLVYELPGGGRGLKLIDFGIAHEEESELTGDGSLLGTPSYMAPEFFELGDGDKPVVLDHRSDLFALGIVFYRALTLRHPYRLVAKSLRDAMATHRGRERPALPSTLRAGLAPGWDQVVMRLLERDRTQRYQTAGAVYAELQRVESLGPYVPPPEKATVREPTAPSPVGDMSLGIPSPPGGPFAPLGPGSEPSRGVFREPSGSTPRVVVAARVEKTRSVRARVALGVGFAALAVAVAIGVVRVGGAPRGAVAAPAPVVVAPVEAPKAAVVAVAPSTAAPAPVAASGSGAAPAARRTKAVAERKSTATGGEAPSPALAAAPAASAKAPENDYQALYGTAGDLNTGAVVARSAEVKTAAKSVRLGARLVDGVAGVAPGTAVTAKVTKPGVIGDEAVPAGAELRGTAGEAPGGRMSVAFTSIRLPSGKEVAVHGVARGKDDRPGIPVGASGRGGEFVVILER